MINELVEKNFNIIDRVPEKDDPITGLRFGDLLKLEATTRHYEYITDKAKL